MDRNECPAFSSPDDAKPAVYDGDARHIYIDPVFGTKIKRLTPQPGMPSVGYFPIYSTIQAFSATGRFLVVGAYTGKGSGLYLLNGADPYRFIRQVQIEEDGVDQADALWDNLNDCIFYYTFRDEVRSVDVCRHDRVTRIGTFPKMRDTGGHVLDLDQQKLAIKPYTYCEISDDNSKLAAKIVDGEGRVYAWAVFDLTRRNHYWFMHKLTATGDLENDHAPENKRPAWACISPDGDYVEVAWNTPVNYAHSGTEQYDATTGAFIPRSGAVTPGPNAPRNLDDLSADNGTHSDQVRLADGREALLSTFCISDSGGHDDYRRFTAYAYDPHLQLGCPASPGVTDNLLPDAAYWNGQWHVSGRNNIGTTASTRGWALVSTYNEDSVDNSPQTPLGSEIFAIKLDGSNEIRRIIHDQTCRAGQYFAEPHATVSRDFHKVIFASTWRNCSGKGQDVDTYLIELP